MDNFASEPAGLLRVTCCLFWTWVLPDSVLKELHATVSYAPSLVAAARAAAAPLGPSYSAAHVRRGDKVHVDKAYTALFGQMEPSYFLRLFADEGFPAGGNVFIATDEGDGRWFDPMRAKYNLSFAADLDQGPLLDALSAFPQPL